MPHLWRAAEAVALMPALPKNPQAAGNVACPVCSAPPGEPCVNVRRSHSERVIAAYQAYQATPRQSRNSGPYWYRVLPIAAEHVRRETRLLGVPPTLRRLHYLLVSDPEATKYGYVNSAGCYGGLSKQTAPLRDEGTFPPLTDRTRSAEITDGFDSDADVSEPLSRALDRAHFTVNPTDGQSVSLAVVVEKDGLVPLLTDAFPVSVFCVRGYSSQSYLAADVRPWIDTQERPVTLVYVGDYDPSGLHIEANLVQRLKRPAIAVVRAALTWDQVVEHRLPEAIPKPKDPRIARMVAAEGRSTQVEVDALRPDLLVGLVREGLVDAGWDQTVYDDLMAEQRDRQDEVEDLAERARAWLRDVVADEPEPEPEPEPPAKPARKRAAKKAAPAKRPAAKPAAKKPAPKKRAGS